MITGYMDAESQADTWNFYLAKVTLKIIRRPAWINIANGVKRPVFYWYEYKLQLMHFKHSYITFAEDWTGSVIQEL